MCYGHLIDLLVMQPLTLEHRKPNDPENICAGLSSDVLAPHRTPQATQRPQRRRAAHDLPARQITPHLPRRRLPVPITSPKLPQVLRRVRRRTRKLREQSTMSH